MNVHQVSNLETEYNIWWFGIHNINGVHYRFDPLTGAIYNSKLCTRDETNLTFYICYSEYPTYDAFGKYIGLYFNDKFIKPMTRHDIAYSGGLSKFETKPWLV